MSGPRRCEFRTAAAVLLRLLDIVADLNARDVPTDGLSPRFDAGVLLDGDGLFARLSALRLRAVRLGLREQLMLVVLAALDFTRTAEAAEEGTLQLLCELLGAPLEGGISRMRGIYLLLE